MTVETGKGEKRWTALVAVISAGAALLGALIGGWFTYSASVNAEEAQNAREERRLEEEARGAARSLVSRFATDLSYSGAILARKEWLSFPPRYVAPIRAPDLRLVMAQLTLEQYRDVDAALRDEGSFLLLGESREGEPFLPGDRTSVRRFRDDLFRGLDALEPVSKLEG